MRNNFVERSLMGALAFLRESLYAEEYASRAGFLQARDPRIKTLTILLFVLAALLAREIPVLLGLYALCLALAAASKIEFRYFIKRTWVFIPLFTLVIAVPALFDLFTPGSELFAFNVFGWRLAVTREGVGGASLFVLRVLTSVSFVILLSITTRHSDLLKVLRTFRVPQVFVMVLGMTYRYIYLFVEVIEHTHKAIKSRVGVHMHHKRGREVVAWNVGSLWLRSYAMSEQVYNAMLSRGYRGEPQVIHEFAARFGDWLWLFVAAAIFIAVL